MRQAARRVPSPDELWRRAQTKGDPARAYIALLHEHGYYSWPLYNVAPPEERRARRGVAHPA